MKKNRLLSLLLALVMLFGVASALGVTASAANPLPNFKVTSDGFATWDHPDGADEYYVSGFIEGRRTPIKGTNRFFTWTSKSAVLNVSALLGENTEVSSGTYNIRIRAVKNGSEFGYESTFTFNYSIKGLPNFKVTSDGIASWDHVSGADGYFIWIENWNHLYYFDFESKQSAYWKWTSNGAEFKTKEFLDEKKSTAGTKKITIRAAKGTYYMPYESAYSYNYNCGFLTGTVTVVPTAPSQGDTLTIDLQGGVKQVPFSKFHFQWQKKDNGGSQFYDIGTGQSFYTVQYADAGSEIRVKITADDWNGYLYSNTVTVSNVPVEGSVTITPSSPRSGDTMTANLSGAVSGIPSSRIHYQWQYYGTSALGSTYRDITDATGRTYVSNIPGRKIRVKVTADGYDGALYSSAVTIGEALTPTLMGTVTVIPASPNVGDALTANLSGSVSTVPSSKLHYQWQRYVWLTPNQGGYIKIEGAADSSYTPDSAGTYRVTVTADGYNGTLYSNTAIVAASSSYQKGDVDKSGQVGNSDLIMVARHVVHLTTLTGDAFTLGDMNDDKTIDNKDIISLARKIVGLA